MSYAKPSTLLTALAVLALQSPSPVVAQGDDPSCTLPIECPETGRSYDENSGILSPPIVLEPLYACASIVRIAGFIPGAKIEISLNGDVGGDIACDDPEHLRGSASGCVP